MSRVVCVFASIFWLACRAAKPCGVVGCTVLAMLGLLAGWCGGGGYEDWAQWGWGSGVQVPQWGTPTQSERAPGTSHESWEMAVNQGYSKAACRFNFYGWPSNSVTSEVDAEISSAPMWCNHTSHVMPGHCWHANGQKAYRHLGRETPHLWPTMCIHYCPVQSVWMIMACLASYWVHWKTIGVFINLKKINRVDDKFKVTNHGLTWYTAWKQTNQVCQRTYAY